MLQWCALIFSSHGRSSAGDVPLSARSHVACVSNHRKIQEKRVIHNFPMKTMDRVADLGSCAATSCLYASYPLRSPQSPRESRISRAHLFNVRSMMQTELSAPSVSFTLNRHHDHWLGLASRLFHRTVHFLRQTAPTPCQRTPSASPVLLGVRPRHTSQQSESEEFSPSAIWASHSLPILSMKNSKIQ